MINVVIKLNSIHASSSETSFFLTTSKNRSMSKKRITLARVTNFTR